MNMKVQIFTDVIISDCPPRFSASSGGWSLPRGRSGKSDIVSYLTHVLQSCKTLVLWSRKTCILWSRQTHLTVYYDFVRHMSYNFIRHVSNMALCQTFHIYPLVKITDKSRLPSGMHSRTTTLSPNMSRINVISQTWSHLLFYFISYFISIGPLKIDFMFNIQNLC